MNLALTVFKKAIAQRINLENFHVSSKICKNCKTFFPLNFVAYGNTMHKCYNNVILNYKILRKLCCINYLQFSVLSCKIKEVLI